MKCASPPEDWRKLDRFRANPSRVRVSVRHLRAKRLATIRGKREDGDAVEVVLRSHSAERAVLGALKRAAKKGMSGVDLGMEFTYDHPFREEGVERRRELRRRSRR